MNRCPVFLYFFTSKTLCVTLFQLFKNRTLARIRSSFRMGYQRGLKYQVIRTKCNTFNIPSKRIVTPDCDGCSLMVREAPKSVTLLVLLRLELPPIPPHQDSSSDSGNTIQNIFVSIYETAQDFHSQFVVGWLLSLSKNIPQGEGDWSICTVRL